MPRIKFRHGPIPIDKFEGMQVIIHVEKVNVELQEVLCSVIAVNDKGTMKNAPGVIDIVPIKAEWGPVTPVPQTDLEVVEMQDIFGQTITKEMIDDMINHIVNHKRGI
jgi:hypothetical protein